VSPRLVDFKAFQKLCKTAFQTALITRRVTQLINHDIGRGLHWTLASHNGIWSASPTH